MEINPVDGKTPAFEIKKGSQPDKSFKEIFKPIIDDVSKLQESSDKVYLEYLKGNASVDDVVISFKKAQISFELMMQVRNRLVDTFEELMRMRI
ncbi:MAG: flagellar hook-basal body complex protein FliE [Planctomycetes bacterium]|nr:flagellar hook-basal body complex protein FliE [Planctomycetota bacterium]